MIRQPYPERVRTDDGPGTIIDYGGGMGASPPYVVVELDPAIDWAPAERDGPLTPEIRAYDPRNVDAPPPRGGRFA